MRGVGSELQNLQAKEFYAYLRLTFTCIGLPYSQVARTQNSII